jgi:hypothetical protein
MVRAIPVILLSHALAEALINSLMAVGLVRSGGVKMFAIFDRMNLKEKWHLGPSLINSSLTVNFGSNLFGELQDLISVRNDFAHNKIDIASIDGPQKIKGSTKDRIDMSIRGQKKLLKFPALPDQLFDLVLSSVTDVGLRFQLDSASFRFSV